MTGLDAHSASTSVAHLRLGFGIDTGFGGGTIVSTSLSLTLSLARVDSWRRVAERLFLCKIPYAVVDCGAVVNGEEVSFDLGCGTAFSCKIPRSSLTSRRR